MLPSLPLACQTNALLMSYAPQQMERVNGVAPSSRPWHGRILLLNHTRENGVPSRAFTGSLTLRTRPLCVLSYGDKGQTPGRSLSPAKSPHEEAAGAALRLGVRNGAHVR